MVRIDSIPERDQQGSATSEGPLCTVVMGTYNRPKLLKNAIKSVVEQTYQQWELVVVNDGGCDVSDVINSFGERRIKYFNLQKNFGAGHSYNYALFESTGEYITYLADDDLYYPNHLAVLSNALTEHPEVDVVYSDQYQVSCDLENGEYSAIHEKVVKYSYDFDKMTLIGETNYIPHPCIMHRRSILQKTGPYDETLPVLIDYDLVRKMAFYTDFLHIKEVTGEYFFPVNKKKRISDMFDLDPERHAQVRRKIFSTIPDKPWDRLKELNLILYADTLNQRTLEQLKNIVQHVWYPHHLYVLLDGYEDAAFSTLATLNNVPFTPLFSHEACGLETSLRKCSNLYGSKGWFVVLDETTTADVHWIKGLYQQVREVLSGKPCSSSVVPPGQLSAALSFTPL